MSMRKFYCFKQRRWIYTVSILAIIILFICMIVNILKVCGVGNLTSYYHTQDILATVIMGVVIAVLALAVFLCGISTGEKHITYILGFLVSKIKYENVTAVKQDSEGKYLLIYYKSGKSAKDASAASPSDVINVTCNPRYFDDIISRIKEKKPSLIVEIVSIQPRQRRSK